MYNYEYLVFWLILSAVGMSVPFLIHKNKIFWKYYLIPTAINLLGIAYLIWAQEHSRMSGQSDWGYVVPLGSVYFLAPVSFIAYILVVAFIKVDIKQQKNT
ncbi:hypothetical protein L2747_13490 [Shewanella marinintestina]|uniref:hypothetical protein n=1 Tax=Shewanella marinintestina TaxID=190305 RepID=UPI00200EACE3|nr:hypothetical protein [Shewanella marinintestina]MCL1147011.1 hypothetical protein [Shewanella marinintestina]